MLKEKVKLLISTEAAYLRSKIHGIKNQDIYLSVFPKTYLENLTDNLDTILS